MLNKFDILKDINILYIEDEDEIRDVTNKILSELINKTYIGKDGIEGLELFKKHERDIDLIITDITMPKLCGLEMSKEIRSFNKTVPIIVTTAEVEPEMLIKAINVGIDKYAPKPLNFDSLIEVILQSLTYHELRELYTDKLTKLSNRNKLKKDLQETEKDLMALIDVDNFSPINDLYGERTGDEVLKTIGKRMKGYFSTENYLLYKLDGDKFGVLSKNSEENIADFKLICSKFIEYIGKSPILITSETNIYVDITIGIAHSYGDKAYKHAQRVIKYAREKYEHIMIYDQSLNIKNNFENNIKWIKKIKIGLETNRFQAFYQPIVDMKTKKIYKYEALIRYVEQDGTIVSPQHFLPVAKKAKFYPHIIKVMLKEGIKFIKEKNKKIAINLDFDDISSPSTVEFIFEILKENRDISENIEFEILESEQIIDFSIVKKFITEIKKYNCKIGIDDFGAGYSNFNILVELDIDFVKLDGCLIKDIDINKDLEMMVETIIGFTTKKEIKTIAEFVSSEKISDKIASLNVNYSQGYYYGKPMSSEDID